MTDRINMTEGRVTVGGAAYHHRINVFDNETEVLVTEIVLTNEQIEALRPYLAVGDDVDVIGEHEIGSNLSLFVGAFRDV